ncbi:SAM-dependent methyltransferase [Streptomyces sp. NPDC058001]|uniref:SAM-dependent methyltransferase n=1 Tax=Streptomyces sp. NPDC058001 TaxID=3346300 RepID=UPI0036DFB90E
MDRQLISRIAHTDHPIAAPVDDDAVRILLERGLARADARVLDLGCGGGEWLLRVLRAYPEARAEGVDLSEPALEHARKAAAGLGVADRLTLHHADASEFRAPHRFDLVLSVGAAHAFGGLLPTLAAARPHLAPGGHVLVGDGIWEAEPTPEAIGMLGDFADLASTMERVVADGWTPVHGHVSSRRELDAYEWAWTGSLSAWALDHPEDPGSGPALEAAATHRDEWLRVYRGTFGFLSLVLRDTSTETGRP